MGRGIKLPRPKKPPQIVEVTWLDAASQDVQSGGMATMRTAGYYIFKGKDDKGIRIVRLASCLDGDDPRTAEPRDFHVIPQTHVIGFTLMACLETVAG